jgi:hypothetical protein
MRVSVSANLPLCQVQVVLKIVMTIFGACGDGDDQHVGFLSAETSLHDSMATCNTVQIAAVM